MLVLKRLKELRKNNGKIQQDMADYLGVGRTTYVKYENGDSEPPLAFVVKLADYFRVTTDYLLGLTDNPEPPNEHVYPQFSGRLKELRQKRGLSEWDMENLFEITARNYAGYEVGEAMPQLTLLNAFADYFDVSIDYMLGKSEDAFTDDLKPKKMISSEQTHIKKYRRLNDSNRQVVNITIDGMLAVQEKDDKKDEAV